jgi:ubiquinone/menaquinone biosynthesis C-methylase UbiE
VGSRSIAPIEDVIRLQAEEHPLVFTDRPASIEEHCLHLMHQKSYEDIKDLARGKMVLDFGCNNGYGTKEISQHATATAGVDVSARAIEDARRRYAREGIEFCVFDGVRLPFTDEHFDIVTSFQVIEHIMDIDAYLSEIYRVLKPEGLAVFTTPNAAIRLDPGMKPWNRFHVREYKSDELASVLQSQFSRVTVRGLFATETFYAIEYDRCQKARAIARWQAGFGPWPTSFASLEDALAGLALRLLPSSAIRVLRKIRSRFTAGARAGGIDQARFSTSDLFYRGHDLEGALDLMAICHKGGRSNSDRGKLE